MSELITDQFYILDWDLSQLGDMDFTAYLVEFDQYEKTIFLPPSSLKLLPDDIQFEADFMYLKDIDYPVSDVTWHIFSRNMLRVIESAGTFDYLKIDLTMINANVAPEERYDSTGNLKPDVISQDYVAVVIEDALDIFDFDASEYKTDSDTRADVHAITKLVVDVPSGGFPPLFKLAAISNTLFISKEAKLACENNNITGCRFKPVTSLQFKV